MKKEKWTVVNTKLLALLRTLNSKELRALDDFVQSPYFNKKDVLVQLFQYLKSAAKKDFPERMLLKKVVYQVLAPSKPYDEYKLNHWMSELFKVVERFIKINRFEQQEVDSAFHLMDYYVDHSLDKHFRFVYDQVKKHHAHKIPLGLDQYWSRHYLASYGMHQFGQTNRNKLQAYIQESSIQLDDYYIYRKLRLLCNMLDHQTSIADSYSLTFLEAIIKHVRHHATYYQEHPSIWIYVKLLEMLSEPVEREKTEFLAFKNLLLDWRDTIPKNEQRDLFTFGINFCLRQIRQGRRSYITELMDLYEKGIATTVLLEKGEISPYTFKNIIKLGLALNRLEWTQRFVEHYALKLPVAMQEDALHYNLASIHYFQKDYDQALQRLNQSKFNDIHFALDARVMLLKIYFENQSWQALDNAISTFSIYLMRQKSIPKTVKAPYQNFLKILQLISYQDGRYAKGELLKKLEQHKYLNGKAWLKEQIEKM